MLTSGRGHIGPWAHRAVGNWTHRAVGTSDRLHIGPFAYRAVGTSGRGHIGLWHIELTPFRDGVTARAARVCTAKTMPIHCFD